MEFDDLRSKKNEDYWSYLKENSREVSKWPTWMRGGKTESQEPSTESSTSEQDPETTHNDHSESK